MSRTDTLERIGRLVGPSFRVEDPRRAWPALVSLLGRPRPYQLALHVGAIGLSHRGRDHLERRMQNPSSRHPEESPPGRVPIICGLTEEFGVPVLVAFDAARRLGLETRHSFFASLELLKNAAHTKWSSQTSASGETLYAFAPAMFPSYVDMVVTAMFPSDDAIRVAAAAAEAGEESPSERARRAVNVLVREGSFAAKVLAAYGSACALCGITLGIVEGAHIYPVAAPNSADDVANGLALCANHHSAFDRGLIHITAKARRVTLHPMVHQEAMRSQAAASLIGNTKAFLSEPLDPSARAADEYFRSRYQYLAPLYDWAGHLAGSPGRARRS